VRGLGAVCITYGVGGLKVINTTAQAYAEESPVVIISGAPGIKEQPDWDRGPFKETLTDAVAMINQARQPVLVAGVELLLYGEREPQYIGLYEGGMSREAVRQYVEGSDCVILLGVLLTDLDLGNSIYSTSEKTSIRFHLLRHVGVCRARQPGRATGASAHAPAGADGGWGFPGDRDGADHGGTLRAEPDHGSAQQCRLRHRAPHAGWQLQ
jgi:TPP-dependent 2-oxoacid decarboxylase